MARPRLYQLLRHAGHRLSKHAGAECREQLGVSPAQLGVVLVLGNEDGQRLSKLAASLGVNKSAMTKLAEQLLALRHVERRASASDGRASELWLTEEGRALLRRGRPLEQRLTAELTEGFTPQEIETVSRFLTTLIERTR